MTTSHRRFGVGSYEIELYVSRAESVDPQILDTVLTSIESSLSPVRWQVFGLAKALPDDHTGDRSSVVQSLTLEDGDTVVTVKIVLTVQRPGVEQHLRCILGHGTNLL